MMIHFGPCRSPIGCDDENRKERFAHSRLGLAEACRYVQNDAKFVNERARNDIVLLSRYIVLLLFVFGEENTERHFFLVLIHHDLGISRIHQKVKMERGKTKMRFTLDM